MLGKYERLDVLGHGVSGIVYLAKDTLLNKQVALKEVDVQAGDMRRFLEEARVMDRLRHPNIVRVNNVDRIDGKVIIDMEYVRGANLQELLREEGPLPLDRALDIAAQILDALNYAHSMQTVHRDIKPANVLIGRDGTVKLVDFGLAEILATNAYAGGAGTYSYMAPEDFASEDRSDNQSDIWAVGVTLYEMLTGERPFQVAQAKDPFAWKRALDTCSPTPINTYLPDAPDALQAILDRALARDKRDRYPAAGDFRDDLLRLRRGEALSPLTLQRSQQADPRRSPRTASPVYPEMTVAQPASTPRSGAGVVVADVNAEAQAKRAARLRRPFSGRKVAAKLTVEPDSVDFGSVRKGELRTVRLQARVVGVDGDVMGRVQHNPGWLTVHPTAFDRPKQTITLTAHTARAWETGEFQETVTVETTAGTAEIPVRVLVTKPRPTFAQIAAWYVPLFAITLLPILAVALSSPAGALAPAAAAFVPPAVAATGAMAAMLLLISIAADIGIAERMICAVLMFTMCVVLGFSARTTNATAGLVAVGMHRAYLVGGIMGLVLLLQLLHFRRWQMWAGVMACLGLLFGGTLLRALFLPH